MKANFDPKSFNVVDFGADPTGEHDSTEAIQKTIEAVGDAAFPPGKYRISHICGGASPEQGESQT